MVTSITTSNIRCYIPYPLLTLKLQKEINNPKGGLYDHNISFIRTSLSDLVRVNLTLYEQSSSELENLLSSKYLQEEMKYCDNFNGIPCRTDEAKSLSFYHDKIKEKRDKQIYRIHNLKKRSLFFHECGKTGREEFYKFKRRMKMSKYF